MISWQDIFTCIGVFVSWLGKNEVYVENMCSAPGNDLHVREYCNYIIIVMQIRLMLLLLLLNSERVVSETKPGGNSQLPRISTRLRE